MFPLPRIFYAMANDGLIYRFLGNVHAKFKTPVLATILSGFCAGVLAAIFDVKQLAEMMSIGTLMAYSLVAISVVILRYSVTSPTDELHARRCYSMISIKDGLTFKEVISRAFNLAKETEPTSRTTNMSLFLISLCGEFSGTILTQYLENF